VPCIFPEFGIPKRATVRGVVGFLDVVRRAERYLDDEPRVSLRALQREFDLDDAAIEELVEELVDVRRAAVRDGSVLVSLRASATPATLLPHAVDTESRFRTAIDIARAQEARAYELRATIRLARLLALDGRAGEGRAMLAPLYASFTEGFDAPDLRDAWALLADPLAS
jgi:hypothetical protein